MNCHLAEFWMLKAEWAWTCKVNDVYSLVEASVTFLQHQSLAIEQTPHDALHVQ